MYRQTKLSERASYRTYESTPRKRDSNQKISKYRINEWKLAAFGLIISLIVLTGKVYYMNREYVHDLFIERKLVSFETVTENGQVMLTYAWKESVKYSKYWLPMVCGFLTTYFTWLVVYLDSNVPGIQPPSPLSPTKYKVLSGHAFHLNYVFALVVGVMVFLYTFWIGVSL